jgi:steroid 5-alpha reductase family enzyme
MGFASDRTIEYGQGISGMIPLILAQGAGLVVAMAAAWEFQRRVSNAGWVDVFWTFATGGAAVAGALVPFPGLQGFLPRQVVVAALAGFWAVRLGLHLRARVRSRPEDARYAGFRRDWGSRFQARLFWLLMIQAAAAWPLAVAVMLAARNPASGWLWTDIAAMAVITASLIGEALADRQLARFVAYSGNAGRVCDRGLWAWSRHPNYFFEFLGWCAWPLFAFNTGWPLGWLAVAAPVMMYWLLVHVSGIPPLERVMLASRGDAYRAYQRRTSAFLPVPPRHEARA